jgi:hypothetical protein
MKLNNLSNTFKNKTMKTTNYLSISLILICIVLNSCLKVPVDPSGSGSGGSGSGSSNFSGIWVRIIGQSGDQTNIAIGGISGEPSNRVYMCELKGSTSIPGLYKGTLVENVITWDATYGLPKTYLRMVGSELEFDYKCCGMLPTNYQKGAWAGECVSLSGSSGSSGDGSTTEELL